MAAYTEGTGVLYTVEQRASVQEQLERLLGNPHFSHSKRFPSFLRFIIREELDGRGDQLKERTLGIEVFGRDPGYDTTSDPIVRVTAAEIRKRIAQYYQESGHAGELRISLPPGSYVPRFDWPAVEVEPVFAAPEPEVFIPEQVEIQPSTPGQAEAAGGPGRRKLLLFVGIPVCLILLAVGSWFWSGSRSSALDRFWAPVLQPDNTVVVCFPRSQMDTITLLNAGNPEQSKSFQEKASMVMLDDLQPLVSLAGLLEMRHQRYNLMGADTASLTDLRHGPAIFLGAFDNPWTLRVTNGLRFRFNNDAEMKHFWIEDTQSAQPHWEIDRTLQVATNNYRDYAIVARFVDANTGQIAVVSAGIARGGTVAAGEFLTQPGNMDAVRARAPKGWAGQNMEFVLSTEIIDGRSAPPKIEAVYFW